MVQWSEPSFHSWNNPSVMRIINKLDELKNKLNRVFLVRIGRGKRNMISMSKIRKRMAKRKNRIENGIRAFEVGSNPHSNTECFSRSFEVLSLSVLVRDTKIRGRAMVIISGGIIVIILGVKPFLTSINI